MKPYQERLIRMYGTLKDCESKSTQTDMTLKRKAGHHHQLEPPTKRPKYEGKNPFVERNNQQQRQEVPMEVEHLGKNTDQPAWTPCSWCVIKPCQKYGPNSMDALLLTARDNPPHHLKFRLSTVNMSRDEIPMEVDDDEIPMDIDE